MNTFNAHLTGQLANGIALTALVSIATLVLLYAGIPFFGPLNDLTNAFGGLFSATFAWQFHLLLRERNPGLASFILVISWVGVAAIVINSVLVAFGQMDWKTGGVYTAVGYGLLGIWLLALHLLFDPHDLLVPSMLWLGIITGICMLAGLMAGPLLASGAGFKNSLLTSISYVGAAAGWLLYPLWCWLVMGSLGALLK